jgi:hypothetical protein
MSLTLKREEFVSDGEKRFTLRMDSKLFDQISIIAKINRRSTAKEIECAIADYVMDYIENHPEDNQE